MGSCISTNKQPQDKSTIQETNAKSIEEKPKKMDSSIGKNISKNRPTATSDNNLDEEAMFVDLAQRKIPSNLEQNYECSGILAGIDSDNTPKLLKFNPIERKFGEIKAPTEMIISNGCSIINYGTDKVILTGGIDAKGRPSTSAQIYNLKTNTIELLPNMIQPRSNHQAIVFEDILYVFGGKIIKQNKPTVLEHCEKISLVKKTKWEKISSLSKGRCHGMVISYAGFVFVAGGLSYSERYIRSIEKYDTQSNTWSVVATKLPRSLGQAFGFSPLDDVIQIIGGSTNHGTLDNNFVLDLKEDAYICKKSLPMKQGTSKAIQFRDKAYFFCNESNQQYQQKKEAKNDIQDEQKKSENSKSIIVYEYNILTNTWSECKTNIGEYVNDINLFQISSAGIHINTQNTKTQSPQTNNLKSRKVHMFGSDQNPFILEFNFTQKQVKECSIPTNLKLYNYQGLLRLGDEKYFIVGGINNENNHISCNTQLYDPNLKKAKKIGKMNFARYGAKLTALDVSIYIIGGTTFDHEGNKSLVKDVERFNFKTKRMESVPELSIARSDPVVCTVKDKIYVVGGCKQDGAISESVEMFSEDAGSWTTMKIELKIGLSGACFCPGTRKSIIYLIGGKQDRGITDSIYDFDIEQGDMWEFGFLKEKKFGCKMFEYERLKICVFGGGHDHMAELFDLREGKQIEGDEFITQISNNISKMLAKSNSTDRSLVQFGLD